MSHRYCEQCHKWYEHGELDIADSGAIVCPDCGTDVVGRIEQHRHREATLDLPYDPRVKQRARDQAYEQGLIG